VEGFWKNFDCVVSGRDCQSPVVINVNSYCIILFVIWEQIRIVERIKIIFLVYDLIIFENSVYELWGSKPLANQRDHPMVVALDAYIDIWLIFASYVEIVWWILEWHFWPFTLYIIPRWLVFRPDMPNLVSVEAP